MASEYDWLLLLLGTLQAAPPEEFDTRRTSKMWAVEQLLRYCVGQGEKLVLVAERWALRCSRPAS
jgi:hypothetical protein